MPLQWHRPETPVCFVRTSKETRAVSKINRLALITMFAKHGPSLVRQGATRSYNHLCLWIFCRICINTAVRQRHIHPITIKLICQNTVPLRQQPIFKGLNFFCQGPALRRCQTPGAFMYMCVCLYARLHVCDTLRRGLGLLHWNAKDWWWMNGAPDVYQYLAVNIPGRRGDVAAESMRWCSYELLIFTLTG